MQATDIEQILFEELGYQESPEFKSQDEILWVNSRKIEGIHSALTLNNQPVIYFSRFSDLAQQSQIRELHRNVWSQSKAPLLFVCLPNEIRIYNGYALPADSDDSLDQQGRLIRQLKHLNNELEARREIQEILIKQNHYERIYIETGAFWDTQDGGKCQQENRADQRLIDSMTKMRELLVSEGGISNHIAYTLLGRSIFIRYLEERNVLTASWVSHMTNGQANTYLGALGNREIAYQLFEALAIHFNGDLFPVEPAEQNVSQFHIDLLARFLRGDDLATGQLSLFPYNFEFIPIELISNIYDTFLESADTKRKTGSYYTPLSLVDFILEETMGLETVHSGMRVLDPACGSGIFLVGAYRRLIEAWKRENRTSPTADDLKEILQSRIFGVDIATGNEAIRIAAFSLYLEILNHLPNETIQSESFAFPSIQHKNLLAYDFFDNEVDIAFAKQKFDRILGNLPWGKGTFTDKMQVWLKKRKLLKSVGGKQAAPAFMLRAPEFCHNDGELALLSPTKSTILVTSEPHKRFRKHFLENHSVRAIVNFSAIRHELFLGAISPTVAAFYTPNSATGSESIVYATPKPSPISRHLKSIVLDTTEIKFLDRTEVIEKPYLWKVALWGTHHDAKLLAWFGSYPSLHNQGFKLRMGFQKETPKGDKNEAKWLENMLCVESDNFVSYLATATGLVTSKSFHRAVSKEVFHAPLILVHRASCQASLSRINLAFRDTISSINGDIEQINILKWLTCVINSPITQYYQFMTSTRWGVERPSPLQNEFEQMPVVIPDESSDDFIKTVAAFDELVELLAQQSNFFDVQAEIKKNALIAEINRLVFKVYDLQDADRQLIDDTLTYGVGFFNWAKRKRRRPRGQLPVEKPDVPMLTTYAKVFTATVDSLLKYRQQTLNATIYTNGAPLTAISFQVADLSEKRQTETVRAHAALRQQLSTLDKLSQTQKAPSLYVRKHVRVYDGETISLVRPSEKRFWTQSQARVDADEFVAEMLDYFQP